VSYSQLNTGTA